MIIFAHSSPQRAEGYPAQFLYECERVESQQCQRRITAEILEFLHDRDRSAPKGTPTPHPWQATNYEKFRYGAETLALYQERFSAKVMELSEAFRQEGYHDASLRHY